MPDIKKNKSHVPKELQTIFIKRPVTNATFALQFALQFANFSRKRNLSNI